MKAANIHPQLEISHLGKFSPELYPDKFLKEIKTEWEEMIKKTKSSPLIKVLLKGNYKSLLLVFSGSLAVVFFDSIDIMLYSQVVSNLDNDPLDIPSMSLLTSMILLLTNYFLYAVSFRSIEAYTGIFSLKLIAQLDTLVYDKLLRISQYNNISEGSLVNFIQSDSESFGEFFSYTPATLVQPIQIFYFLYLLFSYFGFVFIFAIITLIIIFVIFAKLEKVKAKYQKEVLTKKDRRMTTTTQAFEMISIVKLYSWEDYFLQKITRERGEELKSIKKAQIVSLFIDCITWSIGPILSFVALFTYNLFHDPMPLPKLLTSIYIFHNLTDPLFLIPEYINGLIDSLLSLRRLEAFLFSKEYNPSQIIIKKNKNKNNKSNKDIINNDSDNESSKLKEYYQINSKNDNNVENKKEIIIEINNIDFGIIKREEEFKIIEENEEEEEEDEDEYEVDNDDKEDKDNKDDKDNNNDEKVEEEEEKENNQIKKDNEEAHIRLMVTEENALKSPEKKEKEKAELNKKQLKNRKKQQEIIKGTVIVPLLRELN